MEGGAEKRLGNRQPRMKERAFLGELEPLVLLRHFPDNEGLHAIAGFPDDFKGFMIEDGEKAHVVPGTAAHPFVFRSGVVNRNLDGGGGGDINGIRRAGSAAFQAERIVASQNIVQGARLAQHVGNRLAVFNQVRCAFVIHRYFIRRPGRGGLFPRVPVEGKGHRLVSENEFQNIGGIRLHQVGKIDVRIRDGDFAAGNGDVVFLKRMLHQGFRMHSQAQIARCFGIQIRLDVAAGRAVRCFRMQGGGCCRQQHACEEGRWQTIYRIHKH